MAYCPHCDGPLFKGKRTAVIGGGNSGIEAAIDLAGIVAHVTVVEFADQLKADAALLQAAGAALLVLEAIPSTLAPDVVGLTVAEAELAAAQVKAAALRKQAARAKLLVKLGLVGGW